MKDLFVYHVVTEKPMYIGQHIVFDKNHHNSVWQRVNEKLDIVNDIYNNPEKYEGTEFEHHTSVALRELALEKVRLSKYANYPSRMACLYVSKMLEEAEKWFDYFVSLDRPTFQIVKLKVNGNVFYGDATKCFDGRLTEKENIILAEKYWENKDFDTSSILEMLVDGDIEVIEIVKDNVIKKIGYCGNHCEYCFFTECNGCKSNNPSCSYANLFDDKMCPNVVCCERKNIDGCWQCDKVKDCNIGFFSSGENDAKAYALYIKEYGVEKYTDTILKLMRTGYDYPRDFKNINDIDEILKIMKSAGF